VTALHRQMMLREKESAMYPFKNLLPYHFRSDKSIMIAIMILSNALLV